LVDIPLDGIGVIDTIFDVILDLEELAGVTVLDAAASHKQTNISVSKISEINIMV